VVKTGIPGFIPRGNQDEELNSTWSGPMQEEQIRKALNAHWHASAAGDANAEHAIYADDAICDYPSQANESSGEAICRPCAVIIQASRQASTSGAFSETAISGSRNTPSPTKAASLHRQHYGVPQR
jgi:hypothetical protein